MDEIDVSSQKWVRKFPDESYSKQKQLCWLLCCILLAILSLSYTPVVNPTFSLSKGRTSTMLIGDEVFPSKITALEERKVLYDSGLKDTKHALTQAKIMLTETHELVSAFVDNQKVMDSIIQTLQTENAQLKKSITLLDVIENT